MQVKFYIFNIIDIDRYIVNYFFKLFYFGDIKNIKMENK